ncbi:MAG: helix-turn-helix domain-containing protein [Thermodesulfobacteriota bacterium]
MLDYSWPGNVRELENTIKRVLVLSSDMNITSDILIDAAPYLKGLEKQDPFSDLFSSRLKKLINDNKENAYGGVYDLVIRKVEKPLIEEILKISKGNKKKAAEILGINRNTLSKKIEEYGINFQHILQ